MAKIDLWIIKHAETDENRQGIFQGQSIGGKLSPLGIKQAELLAQRLRTEKIDFVYSSPLARAVDTATRILAFHPEVKIVLSDLILERNGGRFEGKPTELIRQAIAQSGDFFRFKPEKGESLSEVQIRAMKLYSGIINSHRGQAGLLVTHDEVITVLLLGLFQKQPLWEEYLALKPRTNTSVTRFIIEPTDGKMIVVNLNDGTHLL